MPSFLSEFYYDKFRAAIYNESGINFNVSNRAILESRLFERLRAVHMDNLEDYYRLVMSNPEEMRALLDAVTTNLTQFFRNKLHYKTLKNYALPKLVEHKRRHSLNPSIRLWSAGCSTGEEPYTNAMCLKSWLPADFSFKIWATDLSLRALAAAKSGYYSAEKCKNIPYEMLNRFFLYREGGYEASPELKSFIQFDYHNLNTPFLQKDFDIIFCRNVLIYFDEKAQVNVANHFYEAMADYSYLFIGHSESLFGLDTPFEFVKTDWACIYGKGIAE